MFRAGRKLLTQGKINYAQSRKAGRECIHIWQRFAAIRLTLCQKQTDNGKTLEKYQCKTIRLCLARSKRAM